MKLTVPAKEFATAIKNAATFTDRYDYDRFEYVYLWNKGQLLMTVFATCGHIAYIQTIDMHRVPIDPVCIAMNLNEVKVATVQLPRTGLFDLTLPDTDGTQGREMWTTMSQFRQHLVDYTIPKEGLRLPVESFCKIFPVFKKLECDMKVYSWSAEGSTTVYSFTNADGDIEILCAPVKVVKNEYTDD